MLKEELIRWAPFVGFVAGIALIALVVQLTA